MKNLTLLLAILLSTHINAQDVAKIIIEVEKDRIDAPVAIDLNAINYNSDSTHLILFEKVKKGMLPVPVQMETGHSARLWFILSGITKKGDKRTFLLQRSKEINTSQAKIKLVKDDLDLTLQKGKQSILSYRHAVTPAPKDADPLYRRSAYIHPLKSPGGETLTRIQAPDHYHHYGIWGPWTKTHIGDRAVDFWNLKLGQGTVKFSSFISEEEGAVFTGFKVHQQHIDFGAIGEDQVALNEVLDIKSWNIDDDVFVVDYTTNINSPLTNGIMLDAYRYGGGIGFRATEKWHKDNCTVLTSDHKTRKDADGSFARWCIVEGESDVEEGRSGILFLSHPSNRMHPEPMRIWPLNSNNNRGDMYFEFVPIRHKSWKIEPLKTYSLKYRMIVFDGKMDAETAEQYWQAFASQPKIKLIKQ